MLELEAPSKLELDLGVNKRLAVYHYVDPNSKENSGAATIVAMAATALVMACAFAFL